MADVVEVVEVVEAPNESPCADLASATTDAPNAPIADAAEAAVGISAYLSPSIPGFSAVLKGRYSDFIVHEVGLDGDVAELTSTELPPEDREEEVVESRKRKQRDEDQEEENGNTVHDADWWKKTSAQLEQWVGKEVAEQVCNFLQEEQPPVIAPVAVAPVATTETPTIETTATTEATTTTTTAPTKVSTEASNDKNNVWFVTLPQLPDKQLRRTVHEWIRAKLAFCARADTQPQSQNIRIWKACYEPNMPHESRHHQNNNNNNGGRGGGGNNNKINNRRSKSMNAWPSHWKEKNYLQFCLYKENMDTTAAMKELARKCFPGKLRLGFAGMKDKRGITTQYCTAYRQRAAHILHIVMKNNNNNNNSYNRNQRGSHHNSSFQGSTVMRVGNFRYTSTEISMGNLQGNRFQIALRNIQMPGNNKSQNNGKKDVEMTDASSPTTGDISEVETALRAAADAFAAHGFVNYFGMQRFGKFGDTHQVGIHVLKGDFKSAIEVIMAPKQPPDRSDQARQKWKHRFDALVVGDESTHTSKREKAEGDCVRQIQRDFGRFMTCENAILQSLGRNPLDYKRAFVYMPRTMRMMFVHAVQSLWWNHVATRRVELQLQAQQPLQIMVGDLVMSNEDAPPAAAEAAASKSNNKNSDKQHPLPHVVTEEDVQQQRYTITDVVLPLMGSKSILPSNETGAYCQQLLNEHELTLAMFGKIADHEVSSKGDYRKLLCVPTCVDYDIIPYHDPMEPLIQTDLMKLEGIELKVRSPSKAAKVEVVKLVDKSETVTDKMVEDSTVTGAEPAAVEPKSAVAPPRPNQVPLLAMVISFTLPSSAYATVALRELMKRPTSYDYQKDLKLDGPAVEDDQIES